MSYKIGIDVGGTFTDFLLTRADGSSQIYKVLSTPRDPSIATITGIEEMARDQGMSTEAFLGAVVTIVHGTTVTTNATLTYNGARTGLLTTAGVRDALEMRRGVREEQYNNRYENAQPVVPRYLRLPVKERLDYRGEVVTPFDEASAVAALETLKAEGVEAVAICFMNSFANPDHEKRAAELVKAALPDAFLSVSSEVIPSIRFYDRVSTTALNAYVGPVLERYLVSLLRKLDDLAYQGILLIMASNGGVIAPEVAIRQPAVTLLSGPAGGPVAGLAFSQGQGYQDCITCDMGGTSFDVALVKDGTPLTTTEGNINRLRISLPMLNVVTIGAGGGSIGWIDEGGLLRMGPQSAGADPGPACYGKGGTRPACTDADLVLGYLDPEFFAGGRMQLDAEASRQAIKENIAVPLGLETHEAAAGMYDVINVSMAAATGAAAGRFWVVAGVAAAGIGGCIYALLAVVIRRSVTGGVSLATVVFIITAMGVVSLGPLSLWRQGTGLLNTAPRDFSVMLLAGALNMVSFLAIVKGLQLTTVAHANVLSASQVAMAVVAGIVLFAEPPNPWMIVGVSLTIVGMILIEGKVEEAPV